MKFKDKLIDLMLKQAEFEESNHEYINPHLLGAILSGLYDVGYMKTLAVEDQVKLDKFVSDMWGA